MDPSGDVRAALQGYYSEKGEFPTVPFGSIIMPAQESAVMSKPATNNPKGSTGSTTKPATTQQTKSPTTKASIESSIEAEDPLLKLNDLCSITYLPDFSENYVVSVDSALGAGSADLAMKYGWMIEHAKWNVDNTDVGKFIYEQVETAETIGLSFLNPLAGSVAAGTELQTMASKPSTTLKVYSDIKSVGTINKADQEVKVTPVVLRVRYIVVAEPGLYPFLKPGESSLTWWEQRKTHRGAFSCGLDDPKQPDAATPAQGSSPDVESKTDKFPINSVLLPVQPYTVVAYNTQLVIQIELVNGKPAAPDAGH